MQSRDLFFFANVHFPHTYFLYILQIFTVYVYEYLVHWVQKFAVYLPHVLLYGFLSLKHKILLGCFHPCCFFIERVSKDLLWRGQVYWRRLSSSRSGSRAKFSRPFPCWNLPPTPSDFFKKHKRIYLIKHQL